MYNPNNWSVFLPLAEWWYNTTYHSSAKLTPYEIVYGQPPPIHLPYLPHDSQLEEIDRSFLARERVLSQLKSNLHIAVNRMKQRADKKRSKRKFDIGEWVFLKFQAYRQSSIER